MSAVAAIEEEIIEEIVSDTDELETVEEALEELNRVYAAHEIDRGRMLTRRDELLSRARELRRKRASNYLDRDYPPINLYSIEVGPQTSAQKQAHQKHVIAVTLQKVRMGTRHKELTNCEYYRA